MVAALGSEKILFVARRPEGQVVGQVDQQGVRVARFRLVTAHVGCRCIVAVGVIRNGDFRGIGAGRRRSGGSHFAVVAVPVPRIDGHGRRHAFRGGRDARSADGARHVRGVVVVGRARVALDHPRGGEFTVRVAHRARVPHTDFYRAAVQTVGRGVDQIGRAGNGGVGVHRRAVKRALGPDVVEDRNFVSGALDAHGDAKFLGPRQHRAVADVFRLGHLGGRLHPLRGNRKILARQNLRHRAIGRRPFHRSSGRARSSQRSLVGERRNFRRLGHRKTRRSRPARGRTRQGRCAWWRRRAHSGSRGRGVGCGGERTARCRGRRGGRCRKTGGRRSTVWGTTLVQGGRRNPWFGPEKNRHRQQQRNARQQSNEGDFLV